MATPGYQPPMPGQQMQPQHTSPPPHQQHYSQAPQQQQHPSLAPHNQRPGSGPPAQHQPQMPRQAMQPTPQQQQQQQQQQQLQQAQPTSQQPTPPHPQPPTSPNSLAREQKRIALLLDLNKNLIQHLSSLQAAGQGGLIVRDPNAGSPAKGDSPSSKVASHEYIACLRCMQANIAYLAHAAQGGAKGGAAAAQQAAANLPGPAIVEAPVANVKAIVDGYERVKELWPGWKGVSSSAGAQGAAAQPQHQQQHQQQGQTQSQAQPLQGQQAHHQQQQQQHQHSQQAPMQGQMGQVGPPPQQQQQPQHGMGMQMGGHDGMGGAGPMNMGIYGQQQQQQQQPGPQGQPPAHNQAGFGQMTGHSFMLGGMHNGGQMGGMQPPG